MLPPERLRHGAHGTRKRARIQPARGANAREAMWRPTPTLRSPLYRPWMRRWLAVAGVYNLVWGLAVVVAPDAGFRLVGLEPLDGIGRSIWQCLGMVIGVYGIGYLAASMDPLRHWPIVLVGLLGKIFGPIGFVWCASRGQIPWAFGATILTNDLLWWIPFGLTLRAAWREAVSEPGTPPATVGAALHLARDQHGRTLAELSATGPVLAVAVRHFGCTFCRETLAMLAARRSELDRRGIRLAVIHTADDAIAAPILASAGLPGASRIADPDRVLSRALGLRHGTFRELLGLRNILRGIPATFQGHGFGFPAGDPLQMPGAFLIERGRVTRHQRAAYAGEPVDFEGLLGECALAPSGSPAHTAVP